MNHTKRLEQILYWSKFYEFSFQFWGPGNHNVWVYKNGVELFHSGGHYTPSEAIDEALSFIFRINKTNLAEQTKKGGGE